VHLDIQVSAVKQLLCTIEQACADAGPADTKAVLAEHRVPFFEAMDEVGASINAFLETHPTEGEIEAAQERIVYPIREMSRTSPFFHHSFHKPRGYPGDFATIEIIYENRPTGDDLASLVFDDYYLSSPPAQAVRNRLDYLVERLQEQVATRADRGTNPVRILNLGSGPARELVRLSEDATFARAADVTCVDLDPAALAFARGRLDGRLRRPVTTVCTDVAHLFKDEALRSEPFDVVYAAGLFDYLRASLASRLIEGCYRLLAPGGVLIIGNFSRELSPNDRILMAWLLEWILIYRDESDYGEIFAHTSFGPDALTVAYEPLRANMFVLARRR
jgi:SAM-dependent methyltransferase